MNNLKKNWFSVFICIFLLLLSGVLIFKKYEKNLYIGEGLWENYKVETIILEEKQRQVVIADNPKHWTKGLMFVRKPVQGFDGMIFKFPDKQPRLFWNQNTFVDLTIYWLADGKILGKAKLPSIEETKEIVTVQSPEPADTVIEIIE
mgnify:CR=1 FL=1